MKILIVEDQQEKLKRMSACASRLTGDNLSTIDNVIDSHNAKLKLMNTKYDLLILDIVIPERIDKEISNDGGINLLREIFERDIYNIPVHIIAVTSFKDTYENYRSLMGDQLINFVYCDFASDVWIDKIGRKISLIKTRKNQESTRPNNSQESLLSIVCALRSPELESVLDLGWGWEEHQIDGDDTLYYCGKITKNGDTHKVVAATPPHMGMPFAGVLSMKMINLFKPKYLAMVGITAGYKKKTNFGDIIAADPVWDWGSGKWIEDDDGEVIFQPEAYQLGLDSSLRSKLTKISENVGLLAEIKSKWRGEKPKDELRLLVGPLASGAAVLANEQQCQAILKQHRKILGIEMESYAVFAAAREAIKPKPLAFSLKSVTDFGDNKKNNKFQGYAAYTSAQILKEFVEDCLL